MKITDMYASMEKRYLAESEAEETKIIRVEALKEILTKVISTFQKQIENDLPESIYDAYKNLRKDYPKANKICPVLEFCFSGETECYKTEFLLRLNGSYTKIPYQMNYDIVKQYNNFVEKYYEVADEDKGFTFEPFIYDMLYFNLNEDTVTLRHGGTKKYKEFKQDLKQAFPEASVRKSIDTFYSENEFTVKIRLSKIP